jgi:predicted ABC-type ATPase
MTEISKQLDEGVYDKGIFKAVFFAGGPGSGKDFVLHKTVDGLGFQEINSDTALEFLMDKNNLDKKMPDSEKAEREVVRAKAKNITKMRETLALQGRKGIIVNGTGDDPAKIKKIKERLEELGYDTSMIMVNTRDEVSKQRNIERGERGGRSVPEDIRKEKWDSAQAAKAEFAKIFGDNYVEYDNSDDLRKAPPELVKAKEDELLGIFKGMQKFVSAKPGTTKASDWIAKELEKKDTSKAEPTEPESKDGGEEPTKDAKASQEPQDSEAAREAKKLGLIYQGFGRYGVQGKTTHRVVGGQLKQLQKEEVEMTDDELNERPMTDDEMKKREEIVKSMKKDGGIADFKKRYGDRWKEVMYATANKQAMKEDLRNWFDPKHPEGGWKRVNSSGKVVGDCAREPGEPKPKCMSNSMRASLSKKEKISAVRRKRKEDPNPERKGEPINVNAKVEEDMKKLNTFEQWSQKYKDSIDCNNPKGFSQKAHCAGKDKNEEVEQIDEKNVPTNPKLWARAIALAKSKFDVYPSAYANGWAAKWYKGEGGGWKSVAEELTDKQKKHLDVDNDLDIDKKDFEKLRAKKEELTPKQKKIDFNKNGKVDGQDLAKLREEDEYDDSGMAYDEMESIKAKAEELCSQLNKMKGQQLPSWLASKITRAEESISTIYDYMMFGMEDEEQDDYQGEE